MFLHLNHHDAVYAERRRYHEREAARWQLATAARCATTPATTLATLLDEAGPVLAAGLLDRHDPRDVALVEALVAELVAIAAPHDRDAAVLSPRDAEPPVVALRTVAALAQRGAARHAPVDARRVAVVRGLLRQLGAGPAGDRWPAAVAARRPGPPAVSALPGRSGTAEADSCPGLSA